MEEDERLGQARADLDETGVAIVEGVLSAAELGEVRDAIAALIAEDEAAGRQLRNFSYDPDDRTVRLMDLVIRHEPFRKLVEHPLATALVRHVLGDNYRVSNFSGNITEPGNARMFMHADQGFLPAPWPPYAMSINIGWAIDDFTIENGGTIYIPGTHRETHGPRPEGGYPGEVSVQCPAGSLFAMDGRTWHQTGNNVTEGTSRTGLFAYYVRPFIVPQRPWTILVDQSRRDEFSADLWQRLGLEVGPTLTLRSTRAKAV